MANKTFVAFVDKQGGTTATNYIGSEGELFYDPTTTTLRVSDGSTPGGSVVSGGGGGTTDQVARDTANAAFDNSNTKVTFDNTFSLEANDSITIAYTDGSTSESVFAAEQGQASISVIDSGTPGAKLLVNSTKVVIDNGQGSNPVDLEVSGNVIANSVTLLKNIVEDTTPQLGGNLDTNGRTITFGSASISNTISEITIGFTSNNITLSSDGIVKLPGAVYFDTTDADVLIAGSAGSPTTIDITRGVAFLSDDLSSGNTYSLSDSFSGAVMQFVAIQSNTPTDLKIQGNFVVMDGTAVTEKTGAYWYPFSDAATSNNTIATAIFYNGDKSSGGVYPVGWRISTGVVV